MRTKTFTLYCATLAKRGFSLVLLMLSPTLLACGLHQATGFNFVSEPGSLGVFDKVITARQSNQFANQAKPEQFYLFAFTQALSKSADTPIPFSLFEAVKGHYSEVVLGEKVSMKGRDTLPSEDDLLLVTELDVLDALATGVIDWPQAKSQGWVVINGQPAEVKQLDDWFTALFKGQKTN